MFRAFEVRLRIVLVLTAHGLPFGRIVRFEGLVLAGTLRLDGFRTRFDAPGVRLLSGLRTRFGFTVLLLPHFGRSLLFLRVSHP